MFTAVVVWAFLCVALYTLGAWGLGLLFSAIKYLLGFIFVLFILGVIL